MQEPGQAASGRKWWQRKRPADGETLYRLVPPVIVWWVWVVFAVVIAAQAVIPGHDYASAELTAGLAAITGLAYATALRPRVIADDDGLRIRNPFRDHRIGWGGISAVYLGDSVELSCARPAPRQDKTIYCWALYSGRRSRLRARLRAERNRTRGPGSGFGGFGAFGGYGLTSAASASSVSSVSSRAPAEARELASQDTVQVMATQIGRRSADERERGAPAAVLESTWAWWPLAFVVIPAAALLGLILAR